MHANAARAHFTVHDARDDTTYKNEAERSSLADAMIKTTLQSRRVETHHSLAM